MTYADELRNLPNAQDAWDSSYKLAKKFTDLDALEGILDEQERIPPDSIANTYYAWVITLGLARAALRMAKEARNIKEAKE